MWRNSEPRSLSASICTLGMKPWSSIRPPIRRLTLSDYGRRRLRQPITTSEPALKNRHDSEPLPGAVALYAGAMATLVPSGRSLVHCGLLCLVVFTGCRKPPAEVVVFYASSLTAVLGDAAEKFQHENPRVRVRLEPSGSQVAARKVVELGMRADIVAVADAGIIGKMMIPRHAKLERDIRDQRDRAGAQGSQPVHRRDQYPELAQRACSARRASRSSRS